MKRTIHQRLCVIRREIMEYGRDEASLAAEQAVEFAANLLASEGDGFARCSTGDLRLDLAAKLLKGRGENFLLVAAGPGGDLEISCAVTGSSDAARRLRLALLALADGDLDLVERMNREGGAP